MVINFRQKFPVFEHHHYWLHAIALAFAPLIPVCAVKDAAQLFVGRTATPRSGGERERSYLRTWAKLVTALFVSASLVACSKARTESEANGRALFQLHCAPCHDTPPPDLLKEPPKLNRLFASKTLPSGAPATDEQVRKVIVEGFRTMPAFDRRLQEKDVRDLIAYLHNLK